MQPIRGSKAEMPYHFIGSRLTCKARVIPRFQPQPAGRTLRRKRVDAPDDTDDTKPYGYNPNHNAGDYENQRWVTNRKPQAAYDSDVRITNF